MDVEAKGSVRAEHLWSNRKGICPCSSTDQSTEVLTQEMGVRIPPRVPNRFLEMRHGECGKVDPTGCREEEQSDEGAEVRVGRKAWKERDGEVSEARPREEMKNGTVAPLREPRFSKRNDVGSSPARCTWVLY